MWKIIKKDDQRHHFIKQFIIQTPNINRIKVYILTVENISILIGNKCQSHYTTPRTPSTLV